MEEWLCHARFEGVVGWCLPEKRDSSTSGLRHAARSLVKNPARPIALSSLALLIGTNNTKTDKWYKRMVRTSRLFFFLLIQYPSRTVARPLSLNLVSIFAAMAK